MDNLFDTFGSLSTTTREGKLGDTSTSSGVGGSGAKDWQGGSDWELNAVTVKEFVPGKGWSATTPPTESSTPQHGELKL